MKLSVFGREMEVVQHQQRWVAYYLGNEGKKRIASDIHIPDGLTESEVVTWLADLCHEWATARHDRVILLSR